MRPGFRHVSARDFLLDERHLMTSVVNLRMVIHAEDAGHHTARIASELHHRECGVRCIRWAHAEDDDTVWQCTGDEAEVEEPIVDDGEGLRRNHAREPWVCCRLLREGG